MYFSRFNLAIVWVLAVATIIFGMSKFVHFSSERQVFIERDNDDNALPFVVSLIRIADGEIFWGAFRFKIKDFFDRREFRFEDLNVRKISGFPEKFVPQGFCSTSGSTFVSGGTAGLRPGGAGVFRLDFEDATVSPYMRSSDFRFRNCAFGNVWTPVFWAVSHGTWTLVIRRLSDGKEFSHELPGDFRGSSWKNAGERLVFSHFLAFSDLDEDGMDEAYVSATSPNFDTEKWSAFQEFWTVYRLSFSKTLDSFVAEDVWISDLSYVRRIAQTSFFWVPGILALYEGTLSKTGRRMPPRLYHLHLKDGRMVSELVFEIPSEHLECKEISQSEMFAYPTVQIGCDNATVYVLKRQKEGVSTDRVIRLEDFKMPSLMVKTPKSDASWEKSSIHMIASEDIDGDGKNETIISVNNDGIYLFDFFRSNEPIGKISFVPTRKNPLLENDFPMSESYLIMDSTVLVFER